MGSTLVESMRVTDDPVNVGYIVGKVAWRRLTSIGWLKTLRS
jgi:hypothetical protein